MGRSPGIGAPGATRYAGVNVLSIHTNQAHPGLRRADARRNCLRFELCSAPQTEERVRVAKLYFYFSAMNAGKTTTLLQSAHNYRERGMRTLILTPQLDNRYGEGVVASRIGLRSEGRIFDRDDDLLQIVRHDLAKNGELHCVLVDESQFLSKQQVWQLSEVVDRLNIPVLAYGLRTDFRGELFEGSARLLALADDIRELKTICKCGKKATMNLRIDGDGNAIICGEKIEIGGNDRYVPLCRRHFYESFNQST